MLDPENKENGQENAQPSCNTPLTKVSMDGSGGEGLAEYKARLQVPTISAEERLAI